VLDGAAVVISRGSAVDALLATSAIPGLFPPVTLEGRMLVDGMVSRETPVRAAVRLGATRLVVLPAGHPCALAEAPRDAVALAIHAVNLLTARALVADLEALAATVALVVVPPLCPLGISAFDFSQTGRLIERATDATAEWISAGGLRANDIPGSLVPHRH
jgi:NTE family protein